MTTILIVDDNKQIASILAEYAKKEGYSAVLASDGEDALIKFESLKPDLLLLDVMMPKLDGFEVCRQVRRFSSTPIIMISARGEDYEKIMGLDIGADDYIVKPFSPGEVMARIRAILRRIEHGNAKSDQLFAFDNLTVNLESFTATVDSVPVLLTKKEIELLWTLATNRNKVFSRDSLLNTLWGYDYYGDNRTVDSHIKRLRAKLDETKHPLWDIRTIWGVGYKFEVSAHV